jgi:hypothetical protein
MPQTQFSPTSGVQRHGEYAAALLLRMHALEERIAHRTSTNSSVVFFVVQKFVVFIMPHFVMYVVAHRFVCLFCILDFDFVLFGRSRRTRQLQKQSN